MNRSPFLAVAAVCLLVAAAGCAKKAPKTLPADGPAPEVLAAPPPAPPPSDATEQSLPSDLIELNQELARRGLLGDVFFALNQYALDERARQRLVDNSEFLLAHPEYQATVQGHCDERGTNEYNLALGDRRAAAAQDYLARLGVARVSTISYGEERPQCAESSESCWALNRRAHFLITGRRDAN